MGAYSPRNHAMQLLAVGLNHTTAPVSLREKVAFAPDQISQAVVAARSWFGRDGSDFSNEGGDPVHLQPH